MVEEELGVGGSKTINDGTSGWEDLEEEDEGLAQADDLENGHPMEGVEQQATITVRNFPVLLEILLTVARISMALPLTTSKSGGRMLPALSPTQSSPWRKSMLF